MMYLPDFPIVKRPAIYILLHKKELTVLDAEVFAWIDCFTHSREGWICSSENMTATGAVIGLSSGAIWHSIINLWEKKLIRIHEDRTIAELHPVFISKWKTPPTAQTFETWHSITFVDQYGRLINV